MLLFENLFGENSLFIAVFFGKTVILGAGKIF